MLSLIIFCVSSTLCVCHGIRAALLGRAPHRVLLLFCLSHTILVDRTVFISAGATNRAPRLFLVRGPPSGAAVRGDEFARQLVCVPHLMRLPPGTKSFFSQVNDEREKPR